jgi:thiol-disulfide isomerase/thioredoxin
MRKGCRITLVLGVILLAGLAFFAYNLFMKPVALEQLSLETLDGRTVDLDSLTENRMTVLNFWATWCAPCIREMPLLDSLYDRLDEDRWNIILVSEESVEKIRKFSQSKPYRFTWLRHQTPLKDLGIAALPRTIVLDTKGNVVHSKTGELHATPDELFELLTSLDTR